jgi:hypothetical protein
MQPKVDLSPGLSLLPPTWANFTLTWTTVGLPLDSFLLPLLSPTPPQRAANCDPVKCYFSTQNSPMAPSPCQVQSPVWQVLKKLDNYHIIHQFHFWAYPQMTESRNLNRYLPTRVHGSIVHTSQKLEATQMSTDGRMDGESKCSLYIQWKIIQPEHRRKF